MQSSNIYPIKEWFEKVYYNWVIMPEYVFELHRIE